jgi:hypothetical protein
MIQSFAAPIAVIESLNPRLAREPWLGRPGLILMALLYLAAAGLVLVDQGRTEHFVPSAAQLAGSSAVAIVLIVVAFRLPRGRRVQPGTPLGHSWWRRWRFSRSLLGTCCRLRGWESSSPDWR